MHTTTSFSVSLALLLLVNGAIRIVAARPGPTTDRRLSQEDPQQQQQQPAPTVTTTASATPLIVGGVVVKQNRYKYSAVIFSDNAPYCSGVLIHPSIVLTAGHCANQGDPYGVKIGALNWAMDDINGNEYHTRRVVKVIRNPDYERNNKRGMRYADILGDVALLMLDRPLPADWPTISLPKAATVIPKKLTVVGYGATSEGTSEMSYHLREVRVDYIVRTTCKALLNKVAPSIYNLTDATICAGVMAGGKDACSGDSGGPLLIRGSDASRDVLVGLTSFGEGCARKNVPAGYTNIKKYVPWIQSTMGTLGLAM